MLGSEKQQLYEFWKKHQIITDQPLLSAFLTIPRENFIRPGNQNEAYADHPLPIGDGQTISQPTTVMLMLQLLEIAPHQKILEIGAGSGYNAALMAHLAQEVYTMETLPMLAAFAEMNLKRMQLSNVRVIVGDGKQGYPPASPYDRIMVTAAASTIPDTLLKQLNHQGILVIPVGPPYRCEMTKILKTSDGKYNLTRHGLFSFVPLV